MRYAIYYTPPQDHPLAMLAASWLGRDAFTGNPLTRPDARGFGEDEIAALTGEPRRYGFHATLKAPFELASGRTERELVEAFNEFAADVPAFAIPAMALGQIGPFFALVPAEPDDPLQSFAASCVRHFEPFRAPLSTADIARRKPDALTASERQHLEQWGYPYVFEDFRFHMTLTGPVPEERQAAIRSVLETTFAAFIGEPLDISNLSLFIEPERGAPFLVNRIASLRPAPQRKTA